MDQIRKSFQYSCHKRGAIYLNLPGDIQPNPTNNTTLLHPSEMVFPSSHSDIFLDKSRKMEKMEVENTEKSFGCIAVEESKVMLVTFHFEN